MTCCQLTAGNTSEGRTPANNATVRTAFVVGPDKKVKLTLSYPMSTGRNFDEVLSYSFALCVWLSTSAEELSRTIPRRRPFCSVPPSPRHLLRRPGPGNVRDAGGCSHRRVPSRWPLEHIFQGHLQNARVSGGLDLAEGAAGERGHRIERVDVVQNVEGLAAYFDAMALVDGELASEAHIDAEEARALQVGRRHVSVRAEGRLGERRWVEPLADAFVRHVSIGEHLLWPLVVGRRERLIDACSGREEVAGKNPDDAGNLPSGGDEAQAFVGELGDKVHRGEVEVVAPVLFEDGAIAAQSGAGGNRRDARDDWN